MTTRSLRLVSLLAACTVALLSAPLQAASSAATSASSTASKGIGSLSDSLQSSSNSSSGNERMAQGRYQIIDMAAVPGEDGQVQVALQMDQEAPVLLKLPQPIAQQASLARGVWVDVQHRDFGLSFTVATAREPFFLVLDDAWRRELDSRPVVI
ncbi:MAG: hypothetical protein C4K60_09295 [Ideonella sp. MAG2]|nr:MAG: hypothetical protein C4K60_09295 [Ideonella sp. MAG2]